MTTKRKVLEFAAEIKAVGDSGEFEGYGSVFAVVDSYGEVVDKGAFTESLKQHGMPALLWQHRGSEPIGIYMEAYEDERGLRVKGQLNLDVQQGREAHALLKQGALKGLSIGFATQVEELNRDTGIRHLKKVRLYEVSLVTFPANDKANVDAVKAAPESVRDFEGFLREGGFNGEDAKIIVSHGFKALQAHREGGELAGVAARLFSLAETIRKSVPRGSGEHQ